MTKIITTSDIVQNYIGFWGIPNDYNYNGTLRMFDTKEEAIQKLITNKSCRALY